MSIIDKISPSADNLMTMNKKFFVSNDDVSIRLFQNNFLETLTKVHPITPIIIFAPLVGYLFYDCVTKGAVGLGLAALQFFLGLLFWTFFEYALHRFLFHYQPTHPLTKRLHFLFHGIHHDYPRDSWRLVMPPTVGIALASLLFFGAKAILPINWVDCWFAGFMVGYLFYDTNHYLIHHSNYEAAWWQAIKKHHLKHHYMNMDAGYGVSSPLWDHILRTNFPASLGVSSYSSNPHPHSARRNSNQISADL